MPRFMLNVWSAISVLLAMSNTDIRLCTLMLKRSGGSGEAAVLGTKPRSPKSAMLCSMFGKAPVGCATRAVRPAVGEDRARRVVPPAVLTNAPRAKLKPVLAMRREHHLVDDGVGGGRDDVDHGLARVVEDALADHRLAVGARRERGAGTGGAAQIGAARRREAGARAGEEVRHVQ